MSDPGSAERNSGQSAARPNGDRVLPPHWNYEATVQEIERIVARIEAGELELVEVFDQFEAAVEYLRQCEEFLSQRQQQATLLIETLTDDPEF